MRVVVTGGTGFVGPAIVQEMLDAGHDVTVVEHETRSPVDDHKRLHRAKASVTDRGALEKAFAGHEALVHLVAIIRENAKRDATFERIHVEGTKNAVVAATGVGISRVLLMSANGVGDATMPQTPYLRTKDDMERIVKAGPFHWTIFRPSFIAAADAGGFDAEFAKVVDRMPLLPSFDGGRFLIQPIARKNVAEAFARALADPATHGKTYTLVGPERIAWRDYLQRLARVRGRRRLVSWTPGGAVMLATRAAPGLFPAQASPDALRMLLAGNTGDPTDAVRDLKLRLIPWEEAVAGLARKR